jgi:hypothetical protein
MKTYRGTRCGSAVAVTADGVPLKPHLDLWNHSPSGFEWGYSGSGPAQLALAILADHLSDDGEAVILYQDFKRLVVAKLPYRLWELTSSEIDSWLEIIKSRQIAAT